MEKRGKAICIVAPSGTGKSTLVKIIKSRFPQLVESISYTTRNPRIGEVDGENYFFVNEVEFLDLKEKNELFEWALVHSNYYGTGKTFITSQLARGYPVLLELDVQGADSLKEALGKDVKVIFIEPPSLEILHKRLKSRGTDNLETINLRIKNAENELQRKNDFDYLIKNENLNKAEEDLCNILSKILEES